MNAARVAFHASGPEAERWIEERGAGRDEKAERRDMRDSWRASLEALGIRVEE